MMKNIYDIVVLATPLTEDQKSSIEFLEFPNNDHFKFSGNYQTTVATFVKGDLSLSYFGLEDSLDAILSCNPNITKINSVGQLISVEGPTENDSRVWKVFSKKPLTPDQISVMFSQVSFFISLNILSLYVICTYSISESNSFNYLECLIMFNCQAYDRN